MQTLILTIASFIAGFVDAIAGGGGVITFPTFLILGLPVSEIVGTNKLVSAAGTSMAAFTFFKKGKIQTEIVKPALPFTLVGALLGAVSVLVLPNEFLKPVVSVLVFLVALYCFFRPKIGADHLYTGLNSKILTLTRCAAFAIGFYDGFFGPGTGIFLTFFFVRVVGCDFVRAAANTKVLNWMSNVVPLLYFFTQGNIRFDLGVPMLVANIAGGYLGAHTAITKGSSFIRWIYLVMAVLIAGKVMCGY